MSLTDAAPGIPLSDQLACVKRELTQRRRVYGRWVEAGRMTKAKMDHEIAAMEAVLVTVEAAAAGERLI